mmetsp:Transcript_33888/g.76144  ORF Transcript_33888/g.76144 Transcript_33888/m.76144 type:complete len:343 (-) Transcript_33888:6027-7055(-)
MLRKIPQWQMFVSDFTSRHRNLIDQGSDAAFSEALSLLLDEAARYYRDLHRTSSEVEKRAYYDACATAFGKLNKSSTALAFAASTLECDHCKGAHKTEDCRAKNFDRKKYLSSLPTYDRLIYELNHHKFPEGMLEYFLQICYKNRLRKDSEPRKFSPPKSDDQKSQRHSKKSSQGSAPQPSDQGNNSSHASPMASFPTAQGSTPTNQGGPTSSTALSQQPTDGSVPAAPTPATATGAASASNPSGGIFSHPPGYYPYPAPAPVYPPYGTGCFAMSQGYTPMPLDSSLGRPMSPGSLQGGPSLAGPRFYGSFPVHFQDASITQFGPSVCILPSYADGRSIIPG